MPLTTAGVNLISALLIGDTSLGSVLNAANAFIGVGDSTTAFAVGQTDLQATTNKLRVGMDAGYPTRTGGNVLTFESTFSGTQANWAWNEWAVFNAASAGQMLSRLVESNGTKLSGQTWVIQVQLTVNIGV